MFLVSSQVSELMFNVDHLKLDRLVHGRCHGGFLSTFKAAVCIQIPADPPWAVLIPENEHRALLLVKSFVVFRSPHPEEGAGAAWQCCCATAGAVEVQFITVCC